MIGFSQWLSEAFAGFDAAQVTWSTDKHDNTLAKFPLDGKTYFVSFELSDEDDQEHPEWTDAPVISFGTYKDKYEIPDAEQTRADNQFQVFGRVQGIIGEYLGKFRPTHFKFEAYYPGLKRVYQRMAAQFAGHYMQVPGTFKFIRADIAKREMSYAPGKYTSPERYSLKKNPLPVQDADQRVRRRNATYISNGSPKRASEDEPQSGSSS